MKVLFLDSGLLLAVLQLEGNLAQQLIELILAGTPQELVNKGGLTEMVAGLAKQTVYPTSEDVLLGTEGEKCGRDRLSGDS